MELQSFSILPLFNDALHVSKVMVNKIQKTKTTSNEKRFRFFPPSPDAGKKIQVAVIYPGPGQQGATSLAVHQILRLVNEHPLGACEPVFFSGDTPRGFVSGRPLTAYDILAFSLSFEEQFALVPHILAMGGVPVKSEARRAEHPLVMAGGVACRLNPRPIIAFIDALAAGDAEPVMQPVVEAMSDSVGATRANLLSKLDTIDGLWVAGSEKKAKAVWHDSGPPVAQLVSATGAGFDDVLLVETGRGCPAGCRFCALGFSRRPPVFYSAEQVIESAMPGIVRGQRIGLVGASLGRHPELQTMVQMLSEYGADLTPASLDPMVLGSSEGQSMLEVLKGRQRSITLAPEAGSARLREVINKPFDDQVLLDAVDRLGRSGVIHLKLYLMYGLPTEQDEDLHQMISLVRRVRSTILAAHKERGGTGKFSVSINPFVPKPHTPFWLEPMPPLAELRRRRDILVSGFRKTGGIHISGISPRRALLQCLLDRADESVAGLIENSKGKWPPPSGLLRRSITHWEQLVTRPWLQNDEYPGSMVDVGVEPKLLKKENRRAYEQRRTPACSVARCRGCKGCSGLT